MKNTLKLTIAACLLCLAFAACKKSSKTTPTSSKLGSTYPAALDNIITPDILNSLKKAGMKINDGLTPPTANGTYLFSPAFCTYDNSGDSLANTVFDDYKFKFSNQNNAEFTVSVNYEDVGGTDDTGFDNSATYITGTNHSFTIYAQSKGVSQTINYVSLQLFSGTLTSTGIADLQMSTYLVSKVGDTTNSVLEKAGSTRLFYDSDSSSETTTFSILPPKVHVDAAATKARVMKMLLAAKHR